MPIQEEWTNSYNNQIEFSELETGNYTLEVRPVSINSEEEIPTTTMNIVIKQHWALTPWAFLMYLVTIVVFSSLLRFYIKAKTAKKTYYKQKEELMKSSLSTEIKNRKEERTIYRLRNKARYGVARELRTPLSLMIAPL